jgi:hypothetical protein
MSNNIKSCVYYFFNESDKKEKNTKIRYQITKEDFCIRNELTNIEKIQKNPIYKTMFYIWEKSDHLKIAKYEEEFRHLNSGKEISEDNTILLKYEELELISLKNYLKALSSSRKYIYSVIHFYKHLLQSMQILLDNHIVHNNICFDNIVVCRDHERPLISYFSFSIDLLSSDLNSYLRQIFVTYDPTYSLWPTEFHILSYLYTNKLQSLSILNIESIIHDIAIHNDLLNTFGDDLVSIYCNEAIQYFSKYVNKSLQFILTDILQFSYTWDNFSLSITFLKIIIYLHRCLNKQNKFIILFMKLLVSNISLNPEKRLSIGETTNKFEIILDSLDYTDYVDIIQNLVFS